MVQLIPKSIELKRKKTRKGEMTRVEYIKYRRRNAIVRKVSEWEKRRIPYPEYRVGRKREW